MKILWRVQTLRPHPHLKVQFHLIISSHKCQFSLSTAVLIVITIYRGCYAQTRSNAQVYLQKGVVDQFQRVHTAENYSGCCSPLHASSPTGSRLELYFFVIRMSASLWFEPNLDASRFPFCSLQRFPLHSCGFPNFFRCSSRCGGPRLRRTIRLSPRTMNCKRLKKNVSINLPLLFLVIFVIII